jgi:hypothetical protein
MTEYLTQNCPLCIRPAEYCLADFKQRKHFFCTHCTEFQISDTAERMLASAPEQWRRQMSAKARAVGPDLVLSIEVPSVQTTEGVAYEALRAQPTRREDLPRCP